MDIYAIMALNSNGSDNSGNSDHESIIDYLADPTGINGSAGAILSAISGESDVIFIPKGIYSVEKNITIPSTKKLIFSRNARLLPWKGVTITINGTWEAGDDDWIFDLSRGGFVNGDYSIEEIRPEWLGAKGDGKTDDAESFRGASTLCNKKRIIKLGAKTYMLKSTVETSCRGIKGVNTYVDSQNGGTLITFYPTDVTTDLLPAIRIKEAGAGSVFEKFRISGNVDYSSRYLSKWVDKTKFEASTYDMFAPGVAAIEVANTATPLFREVSTARVKAGLLLNSTHGHVTSYDSSWNGLIGVYCRKNSEDYFFQGGGISGSFCGLMIGVIPTAGHNGGISALTINRVHMGFSPYGIYQVIDVDPAVYAGYSNVLGLNGYVEGRFEQTGEAAIKLLPKSGTSGLYLNGFGMTYSPIDYTDEPGRWQHSLPDSLIPASEKQKYCVWLGSLKNSRITDDRGLALKSTAPGSLGTAIIEIFHEDNDIEGLVPKYTTIKRKITGASVQLTKALEVADTVREHANSPISHGNLVEPENISHWSASSGAKVEVVTDMSLLPAPFTEEMKRYLGGTIPVIKITPDGVSSPNIFIKTPNSPISVDTTRMINYEYFIYAPSGVVASRIDFWNNKHLYYDTYQNLAKGDWSHIVGRELKSPDPKLNQVAFYRASPTLPTYIVGVMVSYDRPGAYAPYNHNYTRDAIETVGGLILADTITGTRYKCHLNDKGLLSMSNMSTGESAVFATLSMLKSLPTADESQRGRVLTVQGKNNVSEVVEINITNKCTVAGPATLRLGGRSFTVQLTTDENTPELVASKIRQLVPDNNWSLSGTGRAVICTSTIFGDRVDHSYNPGSTGATGNTSNPIQGSIGSGDQTFICKKLLDDSYVWAEI